MGSLAMTFNQQYQFFSARPPTFDDDQLRLESFGQQDPEAGLATLPGMPVLDTSLAAFESHSTGHEFLPNRPPPAAGSSRQVLQKDTAPNLDLLFRHAARAIPTQVDKRTAQNYAMNKGFDKFRIAKQKPRKQRPEVEKVGRTIVTKAGGTCLLCTLLKRKVYLCAIRTFTS